MTMTSRALFVCAAIAIATPAWARQAAREPDDPAKNQVQVFEMILKNAVETGSRNFATRAAQIVPVVFQAGDTPIVNGVAFRVPGRTEFVFHIQVPFVWPALQVMNMMMNREPSAARRDVAGGDRVQATGVVAPDAMVNAPSRPDLEREYATSIRAALVDAVLDNSGGMPFDSADMLFVFASGSDVATNTLQSAPRKLALSVSAADLMAFRQGKITRDEAKQRIKVASF